jgi:hypothetical protein
VPILTTGSSLYSGKIQSVVSEIMLPSGRWIAAPPEEGPLFCNLGDMIQRWTNGFWKAAPHRVMNLTGRARYSAAFFFDPNYDCVVAPLEQFVTYSTPSLLNLSPWEITYGMDLMGRLRIAVIPYLMHERHHPRSITS